MYLKINHQVMWSGRRLFWSNVFIVSTLALWSTSQNWLNVQLSTMSRVSQSSCTLDCCNDCSPGSRSSSSGSTRCWAASRTTPSGRIRRVPSSRSSTCTLPNKGRTRRPRHQAWPPSISVKSKNQSRSSRWEWCTSSRNFRERRWGKTKWRKTHWARNW